MTTITLYNDFHESSVRLRLAKDGWLTPSQIAKSRRELCGIPTCQCSDDLGRRGPQEHIVIRDCGGWRIDTDTGGNAT